MLCVLTYIRQRRNSQDLRPMQTHAHGDHTTGLSKGWCAGRIYCTRPTARLIIEEAGIGSHLVQPVDMDTPFFVEGTRVTALDANHCPGAAMLLFAVPQRSGAVLQILHTGDFRFHPRMAAYPALQATQIHTLFLDTTYSTPKWCFPDQTNAIELMAGKMRAERQERPGALILSWCCSGLKKDSCRSSLRADGIARERKLMIVDTCESGVAKACCGKPRLIRSAILHVSPCPALSMRCTGTYTCRIALRTAQAIRRLTGLPP